VLRAWLTTKLRNAADITVSDVSIGRASDGMTTIRFAAAWKDQGEPLSAELVANVAAALGPDLRASIETEFLVLQMLVEAGLPAPTPWWFEGDCSVLGGPFLVFDCSAAFVPRSVGRVDAVDASGDGGGDEWLVAPRATVISRLTRQREVSAPGRGFGCRRPWSASGDCARWRWP
jgi:hypothetical protein